MDKAAVVLINSIVSGTVVMPDYEFIELIDSEIFGEWSFGSGIITFYSDGSWGSQSPGETTFTGTYYTQGGFLTMYEDISGDSVESSYYIAVDGRLILTNPDDSTDWIGYTYIGPASEDYDIATLAENLVLVPKEGFDATLLIEEIETGVGGTGFIVSPDGYIITNAHVILAGEDPEEMLLNKLASEIIDILYTEAALSYNIPQEDKEVMVDLLFDKIMTYFLQNGQISDINIDYFAINGIAAPGEDIKSKSWRARVKKEGEVIDKVSGEYTWGRDVAVLKISQNNLPTVRLGDSDGAQVGDNIFIIGYPGVGLDELFVTESRLEPTVSAGVISAFRTLKSGVEAIQTDAAINHGNSGGPVFNSRGEVIGISTFGAGPETGIEAIKFAMPINLAKEFLKELNVENEQSLVDIKYEEALTAFWNRDCENSISKMQEVLNIYPGHPYAQEYITDSFRAETAGDCKEKEVAITSTTQIITPSPTPIPTLQPSDTSDTTTNLVIVLLIVIVVAVTVILRTLLKRGK
jgi:S1-C subfamily serine protease